MKQSKQTIVFNQIYETLQGKDEIEALQIDTNEFTQLLLVRHNIKPTTSERYLRRYKQLVKRRVMDDFKQSIQMEFDNLL